jgi:hypothetical protein
MTPQLIILLFWVAVILGVWRLLRSRLYREACEDLEAMRKAPEYQGRAKEFQPFMADPLYQLSSDQEKAGPNHPKTDLKPVRNGEAR